MADYKLPSHTEISSKMFTVFFIENRALHKRPSVPECYKDLSIILVFIFFLAASTYDIQSFGGWVGLI